MESWLVINSDSIPALSLWAKIFPGVSPSKPKLSLSNLIRNLLETHSTMNGAWRMGDADCWWQGTNDSDHHHTCWTQPQQLLAKLAASSITMLLKLILLFNVIVRADLGLLRYWQLACQWSPGRWTTNRWHFSTSRPSAGFCQWCQGVRFRNWSSL